MKQLMRFLYLIIVFWFLNSCGKETNISASSQSAQNNEIRIDSVYVKITHPKKGTFTKEIITNGRLNALKKVDLRFKFTNIVNKINVSNGDKVLPGSIIASQKNTPYYNSIQRNKEQLSRSIIDTEDILLGFGYSLSNKIEIPKDILKMARDRSGYFTAVSNLEDAKTELDETILKSPIKGIVVNLDHKVMNISDNSKIFCTVLDNSKMEVHFSILEKHYPFISKGQLITISIGTSFNQGFEGEISEINAQVNESGFIKVKGIIENPSGILLDGMKVQIIIKKLIPDKVSIPKSALVYRDGKKVVFTYENGAAVWNDVLVGEENSKEVTITKGLTMDQQVICQGNHNLAHNSKVYITQND